MLGVFIPLKWENAVPWCYLHIMLKSSKVWLTKWRRRRHILTRPLTLSHKTSVTVTTSKEVALTLLLNEPYNSYQNFLSKKRIWFTASKKARTPTSVNDFLCSKV